MSTQEIIKDMALWWMATGGVALLIIAFFALGPWLDKKFPEDKFLKKILGEKFFNFLDRVL